MLDKIESLVNKEVEERIKKRALVPLEHITNLLKMRYQALCVKPENTDPLRTVIIGIEIKAEIKTLLQLVESHMFGEVSTGTIQERMTRI